MKTKKPKLTASEKVLTEALRRHFRRNSSAILLQVPFVSAGMDGKSHLRRADAIVVSCWSSRLREIHGFEMKGDRASWLQDLSNPQKAQDVAAYCDKWSILSIPGAVQLSELPPGWGLAEVENTMLVWKKHPSDNKPLELSRDILFSIIGAMLEQYGRVIPGEELDRRYEEGVIFGERQAQKLFTNTIKALKVEAPDQLAGIRKILSNGYSVINEGNIRICEAILKEVMHRFNMQPAESALKTLKFLSEGGGIKMLSTLKAAEQELRHLTDRVMRIRQGIEGFDQPPEQLESPPTP